MTRVTSIKPTPRELEVLALYVAGNSYRQIGEALGIAIKTVSVHLCHLRNKLGVTKRAELLAWHAAQPVTQ